MQTGQTTLAHFSPPSNDPRWQRVNATMLRYGYQPQALIEVLRTVQEQFGYLSPDALQWVSRILHLRPGTVYAVASFYHLFSLTPPAQHSCVVCAGTACHIGGAGRIMEAVADALDIRGGETTADGVASLQVSRCLGFCWAAPVVEYDREVAGVQTADAVIDQIRRWTSHVAI
jgi:bidirectional [NiFe] hydrogenase diaphorase subunit